MSKILHIDTDLEVFLPVDGYHNIYEVSNFGRVKSLERNVKSSYGSIQNRTERILKSTRKSNGYLHVVLCNSSGKKDKSIHRLVATAFVPNIGDMPIVNHIDGNKLNNNADNLEWCNNSHNQLHAFEMGLQKPSYGMLGKKGALCKNSKPVLQLDLKGNFIKRHESLAEVTRETGISHSNISRLLNGYGKTCGGFKWRYV